jgi:hemoglobin
LTLYERLGGDKGLVAIVDDFTNRVLQDPRVNWTRKGSKGSRFAFWRRNKSDAAMWNPAPQNVVRLKKHFVQFLSLATGGPTRYEGKEMRSAHAGMHIRNPEFDAVIGDLKASLDKLQIPEREQKELLAIMESTRPQIVSER